MRTRRLFGALVAAGLVIVSVSGCEPTTSTGTEPPMVEAQGYFDAWKTGNQAAAAALAKSQTIVDRTFAIPYEASADWLFIGCDSGFINRSCKWVDAVENRLTIQVGVTVDRTSQKIQSFDVNKTPSATPAMTNITKAFRAYRTGTQASVESLMNAPGYAEYSALPKFDAADLWGFASCAPNPAYPLIQCTWKNKWGNKILIVATMDGLVYAAMFTQYDGL